jgi:hypothetical protein
VLPWLGADRDYRTIEAHELTGLIDAIADGKTVPKQHPKRPGARIKGGRNAARHAHIGLTLLFDWARRQRYFVTETPMVGVDEPSPHCPMTRCAPSGGLLVT